MTKKQSKPPEFMKLLMVAVMLTYFWGVGLGSYAVLKILEDHPEYAVQALVALFSFIGVPTGTAIGFYSWKAKAENKIKLMIQQGIRPEREDIPND